MTTKAEVLKIIRQKCLDCSCSQPKEVRLCPVYACVLYPFRMGKDPNTSTGRGFAKSRVYTGNSEQQPPPNRKPRREYKSRQGKSPNPIKANEKDQRP